MGQTETELVERLFSAWNDRDAEALRELAHPDVEYVNPPDAVEPGTRRGVDAFIAVARAQWDLLGPDARIEIHRLHDRGDEVISDATISRTMPGSESRIDARGVVSLRFRDGRLAAFVALGVGSEFDSAKRAAGLEEER